MKTPETILITNTNEGFGIDLIKHILSNTPPKLLFAAGVYSSHDRKMMERLVNDYPSVLNIVDMDTKCDESIEHACNFLNYRVGDVGLNLVINNTDVVDPLELTLEQQTRTSMMNSFEMTVVGPMLLAKKLQPLLQKANETSSMAHGFNRAGIINMMFTFRDTRSSTVVLSCYHYRASRSALTTVTKMMGQELWRLGICVAGMQPGWIGEECSFESKEAMISAKEGRMETVTMLWDTITKRLSYCYTESSAGLTLNFDGMILPY